jgi:hypothetical protein
MSQFTKSGLSKPFTCCGHWNICEMGKKVDLCVYKEIDPETMINCRVYQKNHQKVKEEQTLDKAFALFDELFG